MQYTPDFYKSYKNYLLEPAVRKSHDWMFNIIKFNTSFDYVLDLGCGVAEFKKYFRPRSYMGIDLYFDSPEVRKFDYRNGNLIDVLRGFKPLAFVSLFSTEITADTKENYQLYERLFKDLKLKSGLVSGFYYSDKKNENKIQEIGGLTSYQTLESAEDVGSDVFNEKRIVMRVPSKLFGENVYEVWKIFEVK